MEQNKKEGEPQMFFPSAKVLKNYLANKFYYA
jgi:hypothetical protein